MKHIYSKKLCSVLLLALFVLTVPLFSQQQAVVEIGLAEDYVILAKTSITTTGVPASAITGHVGISPADLTNITGFSEVMDLSGTFATSILVTGKIYAANMATPTPAQLTQAVSDMEASYTDATGRTLPVYTGTSDALNATILNYGPGLYKWSGNVSIPNNITISGNADDVWIFEIAGSLDISADAIVTLSGSTQAKNIFWAVAQEVNLFERSHLEGTIISMETIAFRSGASLNGRALSQTDVTLISNTIYYASVNVSVEGNDSKDLPVVYETALYKNYPNPFNPETVIGFSIKQETNARVVVYNLRGQAVKTLKDDLLNAGEYSLVWNGTDDNNNSVSSGLYFYRLTTDHYSRINKMMLIK